MHRVLIVIVAALSLALGWWSRGALDVTPPSATRGEAPSALSRTGDAAQVAASDATLAAIPPPRPSEAISERVARPADGEVAGDASDPLFTAALLARARDGIVAAWKRERRDAPNDAEIDEGLAWFKERTLALPAKIGHELAERRSNLELAEEDARTGGVLTTLKRLQQGAPGPLTSVVADGGTFDRFFVTEFGGAAQDGPSALDARALSSRKPVADGTTLSFPAGVHRLPDFGSYWREHYPRDLTLRGAGKEATLLVLATDMSAYDTVRNLTIESATLHANDNYLFDIREPAMSITLRNCRITGWDMGAGGSCLFGTEALALRASDCEFLGGYGRSPGSGCLFDVRHNGLLARFERCVIARTRAFGSITDGATVVYVACRLEDILDRGGEPPANVTLNGTTVSRWTSEPGTSLKRDLNELFPGWRDALGR
ncbi:MAG: hypothetical protein R3F49_23090 [Planctomycetota bacterium]